VSSNTGGEKISRQAAPKTGRNMRTLTGKERKDLALVGTGGGLHPKLQISLQKVKFFKMMAIFRLPTQIPISYAVMCLCEVH